MYSKNHIKITAEALAILVLLLATVSQVAAYGELTHYSINRDADKKSTEELSGAVAPDAFSDLLYGTNDLNSFVHMELPGVLYGPLDHYLYPSAGSPLQASQELWAGGWTAHTTEDRSSHGTYLVGSPYLDPNNYLSAAYADTLLEHFKAEFGGDILSYWLKQGTMPEELIVYPDQVKVALKSYDSSCGTSFSSGYDPQKFLESFIALNAAVYSEQALIDLRHDKKMQFTDWLYLKWAILKYNGPYKEYYPDAVEDVKKMSTPEAKCISQDMWISANSIAVAKKINSDAAKIKIDTGNKLIKDGLIKPNKKIDIKNGAVTINFEKTVNDIKLAKVYEQYLEESYEKQTGKRIKIMEEIISEGSRSNIVDIKEKYLDLYQELIIKGVVKEENK